MGMAATVENYLKLHRIPHALIEHEATVCATETAESTHVSGHRVAKAVLMKHGGGHFLAVVPASHRIMPEDLEVIVGGHVELANEDDIGTYFFDCERGAVPALGWPYGLDMVVAEQLEQHPQVYFEAGDHRTLVQVDHDAFHAMMENATHGHFSELS